MATPDPPSHTNPIISNSLSPNKLSPTPLASFTGSLHSLINYNDSDKKSNWTPTENAMVCALCRQEFTLTRRKHHCRSCGRVFCHECSSSRVRLPELGYSEKVRVCDECADFRANSNAISLRDEITAKDSINTNLRKELIKKQKIIDQVRSFLLEMEGLVFDVNREETSIESFDMATSMELLQASIQKIMDSITQTKSLNTTLISEKDNLIRKNYMQSREIDSIKTELLRLKNSNESLLYKKQIEDLKERLQEEETTKEKLFIELNQYKQKCQNLEIEKITLRQSMKKNYKATTSSKSKLSPLINDGISYSLLVSEGQTNAHNATSSNFFSRAIRWIKNKLCFTRPTQIHHTIDI